jgi:hypothetical protein
LNADYQEDCPQNGNDVKVIKPNPSNENHGQLKTKKQFDLFASAQPVTSKPNESSQQARE